MAGQFPAILVTGPRQSGKTAILRAVFPKASYVSLDRPALARAARESPEDLLRGLSEPVIIDEVQYAPELFRSLKAAIDERRSPGRFLLTGSQTFPLMQGVAESLAGRCGIVNLHTLSWAELRRARPAVGVEDFLFAGGFPELHAGSGLEAELWYPSYVAAYLERDVRHALNVGNLGDFDKFLRAAALRTGQMLSYSDLARDAGVAPNTARKWLSVLAASGLVFLLETYHRSLGKRLIKAPKLIFADAGLAAYLIGFKDGREALSSPLGGALWETHVVNQVIRHYGFRGLRPPVWYWRTPNGQEVDLVLEEGGGKLTAVECKLSEQPSTDACRGIAALRAFYGAEAVPKAWVVCRTVRRHPLGPGISAVSLSDLEGLLGG